MNVVSSLYLISLLIAYSYADYVYFNNSASYLCAVSCQFNDSSIWMKGIAPQENDQVYIDTVGPHIVINMEETTIDSLEVLSITGPVTLEVPGNAITFGNCTLDKGVNMLLTEGAYITSQTVFTLGDNCTMRLTEASIFSQEFTASFFQSTNTSGVEIHDSSGVYFYSSNATILSGYFYASKSATIQANAISFQDATVVFEIESAISVLSFVNAKAQFLGGIQPNSAITCTQTNISIYESLDSVSVSLYQGSFMQIVNASGSIVDLDGVEDSLLIISSSNVLISANNFSPIEVDLFLAGNTTIDFQNVSLLRDISFGTGYFGEPPRINMNFIKSVNVIGNYSVPGQLGITEGQISIPGSLQIEGEIQVLGSTVVVSGSLSSSGLLILDHGISTNVTSTLTLQSPANISASVIQIQPNCEILTQGTVTIFGNVTNLGIFQVIGGGGSNAIQDVYIDGSYSQSNGAIFVAYLEDGITSTVKVSDSAFIFGRLRYTFTGTISNTAKFAALTVEKNLLGAFNNSLHTYAPSGLNDLEGLEIQYDKKSVYLAMAHDNIWELLGLQWWIWAAILLAVVIILVVAIILVVIKVRKSKNDLRYQIINQQDPQASANTVN